MLEDRTLSFNELRQFSKYFQLVPSFYKFLLKNYTSDVGEIILGRDPGISDRIYILKGPVWYYRKRDSLGIQDGSYNLWNKKQSIQSFLTPEFANTFENIFPGVLDRSFKYTKVVGKKKYVNVNVANEQIKCDDSRVLCLLASVTQNPNVDKLRGHLLTWIDLVEEHETKWVTLYTRGDQRLKEEWPYEL